MLFLIILILGTLISIRSNSWPATWIGLEINLLAFIPLISSKDNIISTEAAIKYFIIQAIASSILLTFVILDNILLILNKNIINSAISITLFLKIGAAPFHIWFPSVIEGLSWLNCFILITWQKLAPFIILSYLSYYQPIILFVIISSIIIGSIGGLNQTSTRKIITYSSINHIGWIILGIIISEDLWQLYFIIYTILSARILLIFHNISSHHHNQIPFTWNSSIIKFFTSINLISLGGLPPFLGFLPKWIIIQNSCYNEIIFTILIIILCSLITLFYYLRLVISSFLININQLKWNHQTNLKFHNIKLISLITRISVFRLPLYPILFFRI